MDDRGPSSDGPGLAMLSTRRSWTRAGARTRGAFRQHYGSDVLDSSNLRMATVGFISPTDPMWTSTLDAMEHELVTDSLVYRYDPAASPDGLAGDEGTFSLCTFNYVDALARAGRLEEARLTFEKMLTYANHLGLYSEEIALTGEQLGNFPQAFTHLALIDAAIMLDGALNRVSTRRPGTAKSPPRQRGQRGRGRRERRCCCRHFDELTDRSAERDETMTERRAG